MRACFVQKKAVVQLTMLSTNKTCLPPKLHLPTATSMHWVHLDTYICYHITLTFSIVFIRLTTIKTTNCTCNTQSKKKKKVNVRLAMLQNSLIQLMNKPSDTPILRQSIHGKADTRQSLWIISYMLGTKQALMLVSRSTTNREILFGFLKKSLLYVQNRKFLTYPNKQIVK